MKTIPGVIIISTMFLSLSLVFLARAQANQIVTNGDFEIDTSGWDVGIGTLSRTTTVVYTGTGSAQMNLNVTAPIQGQFGQCIDLSSELATWPEVAGKKYIIISAFIKTSANIQDTHVKGLFYTNTTCNSGHISTLLSPVVSGKTDWMQVSKQGEIPATAMSLFVGLDAIGISTVYYDNIQVYSPDFMSEIEVSEGMLNISDDSNDVQFGTTVVGNPIIKTFVVSNTGEADLTLTEPITVPTGFSIASSFGDTTLFNSQQTTFTIRLDAVNAGVYSGDLAFDNNDRDENPFNFVISGTVKTLPEIQVVEETTNIADDIGSVGFGTVVEGNPITKTFTVSNTGETDLTLMLPITVPSGFSVTSSFGETTLTTGEQTTFTIQLDAISTGTFYGELTFDNNDADENPFNFVISGTVKTLPDIRVVEGTTNIADNSGAVEFDTTVIGSPLTKTFTVSNTGETDLTLTEPITVPTGFSVTSSFGDTTLVTGQQTTFTIQLNAISTGVYSGELVFANNDADENPFNFVISGTVKAAYKDIYLPILLK